MPPTVTGNRNGNITSETLLQWRKQDPQFDQLLQAARLKAVEQRWKRIEKAAKGSAGHPPDWKADAWSFREGLSTAFRASGSAAKRQSECLHRSHQCRGYGS